MIVEEWWLTSEGLTHFVKAPHGLCHFWRLLSTIWLDQNADAFKGFWMMPLAEDCREMFSFMTDRGVYTPRRSIQGALNSATQFQARMSEVFKSLIKKHLIVWIDDLLGYGKTLEEWFQALKLR